MKDIEKIIADLQAWVEEDKQRTRQSRCRYRSGNGRTSP